MKKILVYVFFTIFLLICGFCNCVGVGEIVEQIGFFNDTLIKMIVSVVLGSVILIVLVILSILLVIVTPKPAAEFEEENKKSKQ